MNRSLSLYLDFVRVCAALIVALHHAALFKFGTLLPNAFVSTGTDPVVVFFVLSGFVIAYTAEAKDKTATDYALHRFARLYSVVLPAIVLTFALDTLGGRIFPALYLDHWTDPATLSNLDRPPLLQALLTFSFANQIWSIDAWPGTNSPFWSMGYEAPYYLLFAFFHYGRGWIRIAGIAATMALVGPKVLLLAPIWILGAAAWRIYKRVSVKAGVGWLLLAASALAYVIFVASGARKYLNAAGPDMKFWGMASFFISNYIVAILFTVSIFGFKGIETQASQLLRPIERQIRSAASYTFSIYLFHYPLIYFFRALAAAAFGATGLNDMSITLTIFVLAGTGITIGFLARITEHKKTLLHGVLASGLVNIKASTAR